MGVVSKGVLALVTLEASRTFHMMTKCRVWPREGMAEVKKRRSFGDEMALIQGKKPGETVGLV